MATLKAMFKLFDGYSSTINKIEKKTGDATDKILKASGATDKFNNKLGATGASANSAAGGITKLIGAVVSFAALKKGMDLTDTYVNTNARLNLINDGLQTQEELQNKIFASANRSKGAYSEMAGAISKMGLLAGNAFGSNDELIGFTELVQKSFKLSGADPSEQAGAMRQLTQAMGSGRLQGDEYVSISENAPMMLKAIEKYTGLSKLKLKELSSDGAISADLIKASMFAMSDEINEQFATLPATFGDIWTKISNDATSAFRPVKELVNNIVNSEGFNTMIEVLSVGIGMLATDIEWLFGLVADNMNIIIPVVAALFAGLLAHLWAMIPPLITQITTWLLMYAPIMLVVLAVGLIIAALGAMGVTFEAVFGFVGGSIAVLMTLFLNLGTSITNSFIAIAKIIDIVITGAVNLVLKGVNAIIGALNKIPGVDIGSVGEFNGFTGGLNLQEYRNISDAYTTGSNVGKNVYGGISNNIGNFKNSFKMPDTPELNLKGMDAIGLDPTDKPKKIKGTGKNGKVDVKMDDEDLKYLRDIAERDYINKFSTATLAPNIEITFGDVHEEADANKLMGRIKTILQEEIATVAEGAY